MNFFVDSWLIVKVVAQNKCNDRWGVTIGCCINVVSQHLQSVLGVIKLTILCVFVCIVEYFDAQIRET